MSEQILEGTWEEIAAHADEFAGKKLRVTVIEEMPAPQPNYAMLEVMRRVAEMQKGMRFTDGSNTQQLLRQARAGGMYGYKPDATEYEPKEWSIKLRNMRRP